MRDTFSLVRRDEPWINRGDDQRCEERRSHQSADHHRSEQALNLGTRCGRERHQQARRSEKMKEFAIVPILLYPVNLDNDCPELKPFNSLPTWASVGGILKKTEVNTRTLTN